MRLSSLSLFLISLLGTFLLIYVALYYISIIRNDELIANQLKSIIEIENKENVGESVAKIMSRTNDELKVIESYRTDRLPPSVNFQKIISQKNSGIKINRLSFIANKENPDQFLVNGVAKNRDALVIFIQDLKKVEGFTSVESPVSDFAKNLDIVFTVNIKLK